MYTHILYMYTCTPIQTHIYTHPPKHIRVHTHIYPLTYFHTHTPSHTDTTHTDTDTHTHHSLCCTFQLVVDHNLLTYICFQNQQLFTYSSVVFNYTCSIPSFQNPHDILTASAKRGIQQRTLSQDQQVKVFKQICKCKS